MTSPLEGFNLAIIDLILLGQSENIGLSKSVERMTKILRSCSRLGLQRQWAVYLYNPAKSLVQVLHSGAAMKKHAKDHCRALKALRLSTKDYARHPRLCSLPGDPGPDIPVYAIPLHHEKQQLGYLVLTIKPDTNADDQIWSFLAVVGEVLSAVVQRCFQEEIVSVREWELEEARTDAIHLLGSAAEYRDNETGWHLIRMSAYTVAIAKHLGLSESDRELLSITAAMHDVGKVGIPDAILLKPGKLTDDEMVIMRQHAEIGESILEGSDTVIASARAIAGGHHERWDGTGYPRGLSGADIPLFARISSIADVFDALTSKRNYKPAWPIDDAIKWIGDQSGAQFDPAVVHAFHDAIPDILRIRELYRDDIIDPKQTSVSLPMAKQRLKPWLAWDESLTVGIETIDEQHRYFFDLVNDIHDAVIKRRNIRAAARHIRELEVYANVHFQAEEEMMAHYGYAGIKQHMIQHQHFRDRLHRLRIELHTSPLTAPHDALNSVTHWITTHIHHEDKKLKQLVETTQTPTCRQTPSSSNARP